MRSVTLSWVHSVGPPLSPYWSENLVFRAVHTSWLEYHLVETKLLLQYHQFVERQTIVTDQGKCFQALLHYLLGSITHADKFHMAVASTVTVIYIRQPYDALCLLLHTCHHTKCDSATLLLQLKAYCLCATYTKKMCAYMFNKSLSWLPCYSKMPLCFSLHASYLVSKLGLPSSMTVYSAATTNPFQYN